MLKLLSDEQDRPSAYAGSPVRLSINYHQSTLGRHRLRVHLEPSVVAILARGLDQPRVHLSGTTVNGFRLWCEETGGYAPVRGRHTGSWNLTMPVRKVRGRESAVPSTGVHFAWERDETGPVLVLERLPDPFLPEAVLDSLPNVAVDPETRHDRAERRLRNALKAVPTPPDPEPVPQDDSWTLETGPDLDPVPGTLPVPTPSRDDLTTPVDPTIPTETDPVPPDVRDLKEAMMMVNEIVDRLGPNIVLFVDDQGRVQAKRRVVSYIDL